MLERLEDLPFIRHIESNFQTILRECLEVPASDYMDWPVKGAYEGRWTIYPLFAADQSWSVGGPIPGNRTRCPGICKLLEPIQGLALAGFSRIEPGTHLYPHVDDTKFIVLRTHMGLIVHDGCQIRAGEELRTWQPGKCLGFLSSTLHEAVNRGPTSRTVFLVDVAEDSRHLPLR